MSCLEFPGATFVGIHDNGQAKNGLANIVRTNIPEDSIIVELDTGEINCDGNRQVIWNLIRLVVVGERNITFTEQTIELIRRRYIENITSRPNKSNSSFLFLMLGMRL